MRFLSFLAIMALSISLLASCKQQPKGVTTEHGYRVVNHTNKGGVVPKAGDVVMVHVATYVGDSLMQNTREISPEPRELEIPDLTKMPAGRKVPALFDALLIAGEGDSLTVFQDVDSLIQKQLPEKLKKEKFVRYEINLVDVVSQEEVKAKTDQLAARFTEVEAAAKETIASYAGGKLNDKITTLPSGLKLMVVDKGAGSPLKVGDQVKTHYYGALKSGKMFDNSFQRGQALEFALGVGQMIPGFDEGTQQLNHGGKAYFFIPYQLGYGDQGTPDGTIPAKSELIFYVEVQ